LSQFIVLSESLQKSEIAKIKMRAAFFGIDLDKSEKKTEEKNIFEFKDPAEYKNMTQEEKEELTKKMMGKHKAWAGDKLKKGE
jgi:hypothetical protein